MMVTDKTKAFVPMRAFASGLLIAGISVTLVFVGASVAQASQSPTSSKSKSELTKFVHTYDKNFDSCFEDLEAGFRAFNQNNMIKAQEESGALGPTCMTGDIFLQISPPPLKAFPSLANLESLTKSWVSDADVLSGLLAQSSSSGKAYSPSQKASYTKAMGSINPIGAKILDSIRVAITASKSHSIGKLPTIPKIAP
jgi:hypothetical protein